VVEGINRERCGPDSRFRRFRWNVWKRRKVKSNNAFMFEKKFVNLNQPIRVARTFPERGMNNKG